MIDIGIGSGPAIPDSAAPAAAAPAAVDDPLTGLVWRLLPARQAHPERLRALMPPSLPDTAIDRMRATPRLQRLLNAKLAAAGALNQGRPGPSGSAEWEGRLIRLDQPETAAVVLLAGAVWHAGTLKTMVMRETLRQVLAAIGRRAHAFALRHAELTPVAASAVPPAGLRMAAERDGTRCLAAWADGLPPGSAGRLRLKLSPRHLDGYSPTEIDRPHAGPIVERCAQEVFDHGPIDVGDVA